MSVRRSAQATRMDVEHENVTKNKKITRNDTDRGVGVPVNFFAGLSWADWHAGASPSGID